MLDSSPEDEDFPGRLLHQAALWDNTELLEDLLAGGQQSFINSQDSWGRTPLHAAAITDKSKCMELLLISGADPNIQCGPRGESKAPLHLAAEHGHSKNLSMLLQHGANLLLRDSNGMTASDLADKCGHSKCVLILKEAFVLDVVHGKDMFDPKWFNRALVAALEKKSAKAFAISVESLNNIP
ncbi:hypothetical protein JTB14_025099 [Gonioctena quinquepunctata]|nr:hypothetical protein JTB14_025099 [Gonioctena quinquepunctata]